MFSLLFIFALYFQQVLNDSALAGGLSFIPLCGAFAITGPLVGRLVHRVGHRAPMVAGLALIALGALLLLRVSVHSSYGQVWPAFLIIGVGYGMTSTPMAAAVLGSVPARRAGMASATNNTARQIGGVFGIAILGSLLPATADSSSYAQHFMVGLRHGLIAAALCALLGAALTATQIPRHTDPPRAPTETRDGNPLLDRAAGFTDRRR
jgi:MFS transporter, DHA2 family, methylenomycin A resistance protein